MAKEHGHEGLDVVDAKINAIRGPIPITVELPNPNINDPETSDDKTLYTIN